MLASCSTMQTYAGPKRPEAEVAIVEGDFAIYGFWGWSIRVVQVDGVDVGELDGAVEVLPGEHTVAFTYFSDTAGMMMLGRHPCFVTFQAVGGRRYEVSGDGSLVDTRWRGWIEDLTTGAKIECVHGPAQPGRAPAGGAAPATTD
jgi:hypothetical protein